MNNTVCSALTIHLFYDFANKIVININNTYPHIITVDNLFFNRSIDFLHVIMEDDYDIDFYNITDHREYSFSNKNLYSSYKLKGPYNDCTNNYYRSFINLFYWYNSFYGDLKETFKIMFFNNDDDIEPITIKNHTNIKKFIIKHISNIYNNYITYNSISMEELVVYREDINIFLQLIIQLIIGNNNVNNNLITIDNITDTFYNNNKEFMIYYNKIMIFVR